MEKRAKITSRKYVDSTLEKTRRAYAKAKADYDVSSAELISVQRRVDEAQARMSESRAALLDLTEKARVMDLTGAQALRDRGSETNYIIDGKEYHVNDKDVNNLQMMPWKEYKRTPKPEYDPLEELLADDGAAEDSEPDEKDPKKEAFENLIQLKKQTDNPTAQLEYHTTLAELKDFSRGYSLTQRQWQYPNWKDEDFKQLVSDLERA